MRLCGCTYVCVLLEGSGDQTKSVMDQLARSSGRDAGGGTGVAVHSIPCRMRVENGVSSALVGNYFASSIRSSGAELSASLRGRPLNGLELQIPAGYAGVVLKKGQCHDDDQVCCELRECSRISSLHYWTLGATPTPDDKLSRALAWTHIAHSLHTPLPVDDN